MAEFPALPLWTDAYLGDTTHLTTIEHGAYLLLLMTTWRTSDCSLPDDDRLLTRYARLDARQWKRIRPILEPFFTIKDGVWRQGRLTDERLAVTAYRQKQSEKGKAGAAARTRRRHENDIPKGGAVMTAVSEVADNHDDGLNAKSLKMHYPEQAQGKPKQVPVEAQAQPDASSLLHTHIPLDKESNGEISLDPDKIFWANAKAFLAPEAKGDPGKLIGAWCRDYGKGNTAQAITRAQLERPVERIPFIIGCLKQATKPQPVVPL